MRNEMLTLPVLLVLVCGVATQSYGSAPARINAPALFEVNRYIPNRARDFVKVLLLPDGTYRGLIYDYYNLYTTTGPPRANVPPDGKWRYEKTGESSARMAFENSFTYELVFSSDSAGVLGIGLPSGEFSLTAHPPGVRLLNCSNRCLVTPGSSAQSGFVIAYGTGRVLLRAVGPGLRKFGVTAVLEQPVLLAKRAQTGETVGRNEDWRSSGDDDISALSKSVGAFPLDLASSDAALLLRLEPGAYVAEVTSSSLSSSGEVLIEIYML